MCLSRTPRGSLNDAGARYVLIGGFAVIAHGGGRTTKDIGLLIDASPDNVALVKRALQVLEDHAVNDVADTDVARYEVVRVADEIVVDLMARACGISYADAERDAEHLTISDVVIPVASPATYSNTVSILLGHGDGTFQAPQWRSAAGSGGREQRLQQRLCGDQQLALRTAARSTCSSRWRGAQTIATPIDQVRRTRTALPTHAPRFAGRVRKMPSTTPERSDRASRQR